MGVNLNVQGRLAAVRRGWRRAVFPACAVLYLLFLAGYGLLWAWRQDSLWQIDLLSNFSAWYLLPALPLLLAGLALKRWRWAALLIIPLALFAMKYGGHFVPTGLRTVANDGIPSLTVMTMNVLKRNTEWAATQSAVEAANPDVIALQEMSEAFLSEVWPGLTGLYPYHVDVYSPLDESSMGLLSRYPITDSETFNTPAHYELTHIRAVIDFNGQPVVIYNLHLAAPSIVRAQGQRRFIGRIFPYEYSSFYRRWQMDNLYPKLTTETLPRVVMGDFNTADASGDYERFRSNSGLLDAYAGVGFGMGFSFPSHLLLDSAKLPFVPVMRLDYIWHSPDLEARAAWLGSPTGSDHLPVIAQLQVNGERPMP